MENSILLNFVIKLLETGIPLVIIAFFVKHWMNLVEDRAKCNAIKIEKNDAETRKHLADVTARTSREIKEAIHANREEYRSQSQEIKHSIDQLSAHVSVQNGRVGKMEVALAEQVATCKQRLLQHRWTDDQPQS